MRRRRLLVGLVSATGTALFGGAASPSGADAAAAAQPLHSLVSTKPSRALPPVGLQVLRSQVAAARSTFHACRYHELARILPDVIIAAHGSLKESTGEQHDQIAALLADAYVLASDLCTRLHDDALAWVTAERARSAAHASGDPARIAEAARMTSIALRRHDHLDTAIALLSSTALDLGADSGEPAPELLAAYGSLLCTAAYTAAQHSSRHQALDLITEAEVAATRLGGVPVPHSPFSTTNVTIYRIGVHTALGDADTALDYARKIDVRSVPTPERQARFCLDTARAWDRFGSPSNSFRALQVAERCAPEELCRPSVRLLVASLLEAPGPTPSGLRELAARCGAVV